MLLKSKLEITMTMINPQQNNERKKQYQFAHYVEKEDTRQIDQNSAINIRDGSIVNKRIKTVSQLALTMKQWLILTVVTDRVRRT